MKYLLIIFATLALTACLPEEKQGWWMGAVSPGDRVWLGFFDTEEQCLSAVNSRAETTFGATTYTASDEEEHGLGLVFVCVPGTKQV